VTESRAHRLGDVLREAREAKGVDLTRVERDTKIRERYLAALESGEYRELPGSVYTKGFLRNYGAYLGLDPDYLIDLYRIETTSAVERLRVPAPPRPIATRKARSFVITPGAIVAAVLTIGVGAFIAYLAFEIINFARTPELRITAPPGNVNDYTGDRITIRGVTAPNATVRVDNLRENPTVTADDTGRFEVVVSLVPGSNVVELTADDPVTNRQSAMVARRILVITDAEVSPSPTPALAVTEPAADATVDGPVTVQGTAAPGAMIEVSVELAQAAGPTFTVTDPTGASIDVEPEAPAAPEPLSLTADAGGAFEGSLTLGPGSWLLRIGTEGATPVERTVTVAGGEGLAGTLVLDGGDSYLEVDQDGEAVDGVSGGIASDGDEIPLRADDELRVRAGNAGVVRLMINGMRLGSMGGEGAVVEWRIERTDE
jgi:cytoskeletal protein RodZ